MASRGITPKVYKITPKAGHRRVLKNLVENGGNKSKAILDAGYSQELATNPKKIIESKGFQQLFRETISDAKLIKVVNEGLEATKISEINGETADYNVRHKYVETALKVQGHLKPDATAGNTFVFIAPEQQKRIAERIIEMPLLLENEEVDDTK